MKVKIKKLHPNAVIPCYAKAGDAGLDLTAVSKSIDDNGNVVYGTGLAIEVPPGFFAMLLPRSSNAKTDLMLTNHCGVLDSGYRGEIFFKYSRYRRPILKELDIQDFTGATAIPNKSYSVGDRVGQLIILPYPEIEFIEAEELSESERGAGGYGSTGN